jgi:hypothetical protein
VKKYIVPALVLCVLFNNEVLTLAVLCVLCLPLAAKLITVSAEVDK